jgi:predicted negative regulator of RcsB-dependent stress response
MAIKIRKRNDADQPEGEGSEDQAAGGAQASDPVLQATMRGASWMEDNRNLVIGGVIALVVAIIGVWAGTSYVESQNVKASATLSPALWDYSAPVKGSPTMEMIGQSAEVGSPETVYASDTERWQAIYDKADTSLESHKSGAIAQSARLTKAAAANRLGKYGEAVTLYEAYLKNETDAAMLPFVYLGLANAHAAQDNVDKATANYDKLVEQDESYQGLAQFQKAKVLEGGGKVDKAKELYHEILESDPKTPYREDIERRLALL